MSLCSFAKFSDISSTVTSWVFIFKFWHCRLAPQDYVQLSWSGCSSRQTKTMKSTSHCLAYFNHHLSEPCLTSFPQDNVLQGNMVSSQGCWYAKNNISVIPWYRLSFLCKAQHNVPHCCEMLIQKVILQKGTK